MAEVRADFPAMEAFAAGTVARHDQIDQVRDGLNTARLPRDAFGYILGVGGKVHDAYEDFVTSCAGVTELAGHTMLELARVIRNAAETLAGIDQVNADDLTEGGTLRPGAR
jgi:hypothetical protein